MGFLSALIPAAAGVLGSIFSGRQQQRTNQQQIDLSREQMDFQERMSSTAHQREVNDLKAAGLNPILSANAGASTPGGAMATLDAPFQSLSNDVASSAKSYMEMSMNKELIKSQKTGQQLDKANAASARANARLLRAQERKVSGGSIGGGRWPFDIPIKTIISSAKDFGNFLKVKLGKKG